MGSHAAPFRLLGIVNIFSRLYRGVSAAPGRSEGFAPSESARPAPGHLRSQSLTVAGNSVSLPRETWHCGSESRKSFP